MILHLMAELQIHICKNVAEADMGSEHSVLLVNNGLVYSTGLGTSGQLGNGASDSSDGYVRVVDSDGNYLENAVNVSAGYNQSATVTRGSNLYMGVITHQSNLVTTRLQLNHRLLV